MPELAGGRRGPWSVRFLTDPALRSAWDRLTGRDEVVANEALLALVGTVHHFAGVFEIGEDEEAGEEL